MIDAGEIAGHATSLRARMLTSIKAVIVKYGPNLDTPGLDVRFQAARQARRQLSSQAPDSKKRPGVRPECKAHPTTLARTIIGASR
jgi:hypothetical protein